ncbi:PREDICTED: uncharacterized protein LOC104599326 isoform X2 [Nelumbo nucifera]|uniref:Uncharacterized protein LOC104599326 isoform X2 n=1 Tax=Nelumbo nucifera TaxID=4432 RepID=A0A1U7ZZU0_NELNU|nr:PREDICTED: uncharacterized protein LOC104599326 isoform X2 [Nelumbo nucifera]
MMEGEDGLKTVECLRGRLLAERVASRVAKEDAELMGNKVIEMERKIRIEIKSRNRAEKKLKFLVKKVESLKLSHVFLDQCSSSETGEDSGGSSKNSSGLKEPESVKCGIEEERSTTSGNPRNGDPESNVTKPCHGGSSNSVGSAHPSEQPSSSSVDEGPSSEQPSQIEDRSSDEPVTDGLREAPTPGERESNGENNPVLEDVDNTLALVPVSSWPASQTSEPKIINDHNVRDVLAALRHAREQLENSIHSRSVDLCRRV